MSRWDGGWKGVVWMGREGGGAMLSERKEKSSGRERWKGMGREGKRGGYIELEKGKGIGMEE